VSWRRRERLSSYTEILGLDIVRGRFLAQTDEIISLLVGGIGIMNIMLATVTERTREIGVRRALGAKRRHITMQFLVEAVVLSVGGGLIGVMVGIVVPIMVSHVTAMRTIVTPWSVLLAFSISGAIGIIFGFYRAKAAAQLDPIEALRHE
jgi:putative ABC transport system permease protein